MLTATKNPSIGSYVDTSHVNNLLSTYKKERWLHNSKRIGKEDSLSIWYSLKELQEFLEDARKNGADGIKMYFGQYTQQTAKTPAHLDRQTIVLVATKHKTFEDGASVDKSIYVQAEKGTTILAYNMGRPCPPFCGGFGMSQERDSLGTTLIDNQEDGMTVI